MDADPAAAPATLGPDLWAACEERAVVCLTFTSGQRLTGHYTSRVGLHFLHRTGRDLPLIGEVTGPYGPGDMLAVEVVRTRAQVLANAYVRLHGERVPSREPVTRDEHEHRLRVLARAVADAEADWQRQMQLHRQFREAADRIGLGPGQARLAAQRRRLGQALQCAAHHGRSLGGCGGVALPAANASRFRDLARPRPQDFDPDPQARRRRTTLPPHVRADPWSIPNILHALRAASLKARVLRLGDPPHDAGHLQIDMPIKGRSRFVAIAERDIHGRMGWRWVWDGNHSKAGLAQHRRALRCDAYARMVEVLRHGRRGVQADLFCRPG